jgi:hypothetical protein
MAGLNTAAFLLLAASYRLVLPKGGLAAIVFWVWLAFLQTGTLGAVVNATPFEQYIRVLYPFTLFLMGFLVVWWTARDPRDASIIVSAMIATAIISLFFTLWWGFYFTGVGVDHIRYQVLSPLIPLLMVVAGYDLFFARRKRLWSIFLLSFIVSLIVLSVTRGPVLVGGVVAGLVVLAVLVNALRSGSVPRPTQDAFIWGLCVSVIGLGIATLFYPEVIERWSHRALGAGQNVTFWMRAAAVIGQFDALTESSHGWFMGRGIGSSYPWPLSEFPWILPYIGERVDGPVWFPGEFMWMPFFYYGGFAFGTGAALVLLWGATRGFWWLMSLLRVQSWRIPLFRPLWIGILGYFAFLAMGFSANPFIFRSAALFMGLCLGLIIVQSSPASSVAHALRSRVT